MRPEWDDLWMDLALGLAARSTCSRTQVGCVVVTLDNHRVLAVGYNGGAKGLSNECLSLEPGMCGHLHAEINALVKMNFNEAAPKKLYVTHMPCLTCAVAIVNAGIRRVIYLNDYRKTDGVELLTRGGVEVWKQIPKELRQEVALYLEEDGSARKG